MAGLDLDTGLVTGFDSALNRQTFILFMLGSKTGGHKTILKYE